MERGLDGGAVDPEGRPSREGVHGGDAAEAAAEQAPLSCGGRAPGADVGEMLEELDRLQRRFVARRQVAEMLGGAMQAEA